MVYIVGAIFLVVVIITNIFAFRIKFLLKENDYKTSPYFNHFTDLINFRKLTLSRREYKSVAYYFWICIIGYLLLLSSMIVFFITQ